MSKMRTPLYPVVNCISVMVLISFILISLSGCSEAPDNDLINKAAFKKSAFTNSVPQDAEDNPDKYVTVKVNNSYTKTINAEVVYFYDTTVTFHRMNDPVLVGLVKRGNMWYLFDN